MRVINTLSAALLAGLLATAGSFTPAAAAWHGGGWHGGGGWHHGGFGWGGAALGAGLALGALGALSTPYYYGAPYYGYADPYYGPECGVPHRYWRHGVWHYRYAC
jgi:hypothetical protein